MKFSGLDNLCIRHADKDSTEAEIIVQPMSSVPFFLNPIKQDEETKFKMPKFEIENFDDDCDAQVD